MRWLLTHSQTHPCPTRRVPDDQAKISNFNRLDMGKRNLAPRHNISDHQSIRREGDCGAKRNEKEQGAHQKEHSGLEE